MGVGFSEGQSPLPFYLCRFRKTGNFYHFLSISGWSLETDLPFETEFFPPARCAHRVHRGPGKAIAHATTRTPAPAPHPRLAPLPTLASVASRATITRRSPPHRDRWRRPALRHPAQPRNSEISRAPAARMTFTILRELCRPYTFTIFYATKSFSQSVSLFLPNPHPLDAQNAPRGCLAIMGVGRGSVSLVQGARSHNEKKGGAGSGMRARARVACSACHCAQKVAGSLGRGGGNWEATAPICGLPTPRRRSPPRLRSAACSGWRPPPAFGAAPPGPPGSGPSAAPPPPSRGWA